MGNANICWDTRMDCLSGGNLTIKTLDKEERPQPELNEEQKTALTDLAQGRFY